MTKRTPEIINRIRFLASDGATTKEIARDIGGVASWTVSRWAAAERIPLPTRSQALRRAMADPAVRARHAAAMADPAVRARHAAAMADPAVRARHAAAMADPAVRARIKASRKGIKGFMIPKWVPPSLQDEYLDVAAEEGEEIAASRVRALKREMSLAGVPA